MNDNVCKVVSPNPTQAQVRSLVMAAASALQLALVLQLAQMPGPVADAVATASGCTRYAKKRRMLREHRAEMRVTADNHLGDELQMRVIEETGNTGFWLGIPSDMDEESDVEDPESDVEDPELAELARRQEKKEKQDFVQAAADLLKQRLVGPQMAQDFDRAQMELEDWRSRALRKV